MPVESNKAVVERFMKGPWNYERLLSFENVLADDFVFRGPWGELHGVSAFRQVIAKELEVLADKFVQIEEMVAEGDTVAARYTSWFVHHGAFLGAMPTGRTITMHGVAIHRVVDGKIVETWDAHDRLRLLRDLGSEERLADHDEAAIRGLIAKGLEAGFKNYVTSCYTDDCEMVPARGVPVRGRGEIARWVDEFPPISEWKVSELEIGGACEVAYASGRYTMMIASKPGRRVRDSGTYVEVWRRQPDNGWKIVRSMFHSNIPVATRSSANA
jgi:predicted ester cyclase/ketosteroid isomerase-like protein